MVSYRHDAHTIRPPGTRGASTTKKRHTHLVDPRPRHPEPRRDPAPATALEPLPGELADVGAAPRVRTGEAAVELAFGEGGAHPGERVQEDVGALACFVGLVGRVGVEVVGAGRRVVDAAGAASGGEVVDYEVAAGEEAAAFAAFDLDVLLLRRGGGWGWFGAGWGLDAEIVA